MADNTENIETKHVNFSDRITRPLEFTGTAGDLWPLALKNAVFSILTLGLYRFWARTHVRRYLWSHLVLDGDPLEYTGTGMEMFKGFLIALVTVFLPFLALFLFAQTILITNPPLAGIVLIGGYMALIWVMFFGIYMAQRYRLSRTHWRGIRGALLGKGSDYAWRGLGWSLFAAITFGIGYPLAENKLYTYEVNNRRFGSGEFYYGAGSGGLYKSFGLSVLVFIGGMIAFTMAMAAFAVSTAEGGLEADALPVTKLILMYLMIYVIMGLAFSIYLAGQMRHWLNHTFFQDRPMLFKVTALEVLSLFFINFLIIIFTLTIGTPIAQMRVVRFYVERLSVEGVLKFDELKQADGPMPSTGEGIAEGFDMGTI